MRLKLQGNIFVDKLISQIDKIYQMSGESKELPLGVLTSENRDTWTRLRNELLQSPLNQASLNMIETAAFVVCLDDS